MIKMADYGEEWRCILLASHKEVGLGFGGRADRGGLG